MGSRRYAPPYGFDSAQDDTVKVWSANTNRENSHRPARSPRRSKMTARGGVVKDLGGRKIMDGVGRGFTSAVNVGEAPLPKITVV